MPKARTTIVNKRGLHARASSKLAGLAAEFSADIKLHTSDRHANATSIMELMMLAASLGTEVAVECEGDNAEHALQAIIQLIENGFDETDD
ncbi:Phosphocarrier protein HPr [BD1-7 clade bacterium]|uniref:Phosphocarrier protein HPr n=1 Tax=BD1-7 clade bacterium TaxID=2029982 RepID=A0A5S9MQI5_9GAMM|nr:Phosphocarrier protein HPr [BD1-7 clade bacterium]CAA0081241.1 Phosphocarrier protein HPr [BD1-7 clade bacterium]CAA0084810.1 Phosphocarrier protein HPr [BD1-7 clade bacterium]